MKGSWVRTGLAIRKVILANLETRFGDETFSKLGALATGHVEHLITLDDDL